MMYGNQFDSRAHAFKRRNSLNNGMRTGVIFFAIFSSRASHASRLPRACLSLLQQTEKVKDSSRAEFVFREMFEWK